MASGRGELRDRPMDRDRCRDAARSTHGDDVRASPPKQLELFGGPTATTTDEEKMDGKEGDDADTW